MAHCSFPRLTEGTGGEVLDVLGPTVEFLNVSHGQYEQFCLMRAVVPPGATVPLHSHDDVEAFYIVSGAQEVLAPGEDGLQWRVARAGDFVYLAGGALHAHRNVSDEDAVDLIITTPRMGAFFREIGVPIDEVGWHTPQQRLGVFVETALRYGMRLGTPEENAAVGIELPAG
ncbi:cupin domain-containing protein [Mycolicibacterium baixiangningiae]|uniref:cupin domain-containing protein n=1 Tax=Mycolicibacterium baixiangningiae TaxID=2761578 RepID=UPI0018679896|nr:cupin domain-containing protein [Mycolicibacterium baixiangningiae]